MVDLCVVVDATVVCGSFCRRRRCIDYFFPFFLNACRATVLHTCTFSCTYDMDAGRPFCVLCHFSHYRTTHAGRPKMNIYIIEIFIEFHWKTHLILSLAMKHNKGACFLQVSDQKIECRRRPSAVHVHWMPDDPPRNIIIFISPIDTSYIHIWKLTDIQRNVSQTSISNICWRL